ncbi:amino acid ABC transporter permease [Acetobacterium carbinolicum]|uniref:amino acid ABC transporter permease n=1 Tax=Acetobacterium TaxID=33951 RepID=UPI000DBEC3E8|nr:MULTISPECIES: amino acid ABC transporter permease [unclassified Acetobacterium]AWW27101.1 amino acid ABC transporter permease [Acetobacterium sp. KB-1]MDK2941082.1 glutamine transport system permease protein [Acetobacterium sp.]MDZ5724300.1 amino acid ABC transporter permease [Acetobacterium sp. K1/6]
MNILELVVQYWPRLIAGLGLTVQITIISLICAGILGMVFGLLSVSKRKTLRAIALVYVDVVRGTPLLVQAFFIYFGIPQVLGIQSDPVISGVITLSLNAGGYLAEIVRGGIESIGKGQMEAARSLGLPYGMAMRSVILPQAIRTMTPALINQCIITLKDTSLLSVISVTELTQTGRLIIANNFRSFEVWFIVAVMYFVIIMILSKISKRIERKMSYGKSNN